MAQQSGIIHFIDMVAAEDENIIGPVRIDKIHVLIDGVGRALVPRTAVPLLDVWGQDMHPAIGAVQVPRLSVSDIAVELQRTVLGEHAHGVDARVDAVGQGKIDDAEFASEGDGGLGHMAGKHVEAASLTARQQHGHTFFFHPITS